MKYNVQVSRSDGQLATDETVDTLGAMQEIMYALEQLASEADYAVHIDIELLPETEDELDAYKEKFFS